MESDTDIPCAACLFWDPQEKSFSCDPNNCKKLSDWLLKHAQDDTTEPQDTIVQYVV